MKPDHFTEKRMRRWLRGAAVLSLAAAVASHADGDRPLAGKPEAVKASETRGVEMSATASVVQKGVKRGTQINLEKALDLIARPRPGGGGGSKSAAGIGGGGGRPAGGGKGDGKTRAKMKGQHRQRMSSGS